MCFGSEVTEKKKYLLPIIIDFLDVFDKFVYSFTPGSFGIESTYRSNQYFLIDFYCHTNIRYETGNLA